MYGTITSHYEYNMNDGGSDSELEVVLSEKDLGALIISKPHFTLGGISKLIWYILNVVRGKGV